MMFLRKLIYRWRFGRILQEQSEWMNGALGFLQTNFPLRHRSVIERMAIHLAVPNANTPFQITQMIVRELNEAREEI
jgi:hypothetical protein